MRRFVAETAQMIPIATETKGKLLTPASATLVSSGTARTMSVGRTAVMWMMKTKTEMRETLRLPAPARKVTNGIL